MDESASLQDVTRCVLCQTKVVHSYCETCQTSLCESCIGDHISNENVEHDIVFYHLKNSFLSYPKCETHQNQISELCKDCNVLLCSLCKAHQEHKNHRFVEITNVYKSKKKIIENDQKELKDFISPSYEQLLLDIEIKMSNIDGDYEYLEDDISKRGEEIHREIDIVIKEMKDNCREMKKEHRCILNAHFNEVKRKLSRIKQTIISLNKMEKTKEVSELIEYNSEVREFCNISKVTVSMPVFVHESIDRKKLRSSFGDIIPLSSATKKNVLLPKHPNSKVRELLDEPILLATIHTEYKDLFSVACVNGEQIWTSGRSNIIKCLNTKGRALDTIDTKETTYPVDIALCKNGDLLYSDSQKKTVNRVINGQTDVFITFKGWAPRNLCVTINGDVLIAMHSDEIVHVQNNSPQLYADYGIQSKIIRYSDCNEIQTIQYDGEGKPLYSAAANIKFISENKNSDICVSDSDAGAVVVVNKAGELRWRYTGNPQLQYSSKYSFQPFGISTDSQSRILLAEYTKQCIHILDQDGEFLQCIDNVAISTPYGLCVDYNDDLFACAHQIGNILKIKYS